jgi:flagella basal body P-ring formation protein FlgA
MRFLFILLFTIGTKSLFGATLSELVSSQAAANASSSPDYNSDGNQAPGTYSPFLNARELKEKIQKDITDKLLETYGEAYKPAFVKWHIPSKAHKAYDITEITVTPERTQFIAHVYFKTPRGTKSVKVMGKLDEMVPVVTLNRSIQYGEVIQAEDIATMTIPLSRFSKHHLTSANLAIGKTPKRNFLKTNVPLSNHDLMDVMLVEKGAPVKLTYSSTNLTMTSTGIAQSAGASGQMIPVKISGSKKQIHAKVIGINQAEVISDES